MELDTFHFELNEYLTPVRRWPKEGSLNRRHLRCTPSTLYTLCALAEADIPMLPYFKWTNSEVLAWIAHLGYPQYKTTFCENMINGRTLLLVDASALCHMNIKNFNHIQDIAKAIRHMYQVEMVLFSRSISLPRRLPGTLYKIYKVCTGPTYERKTKYQLWNQMGIVQNMQPNDNHWAALTQRLQHIRYDQQHRIGLAPIHTMYKVRMAPHLQEEPKLLIEDEFDVGCNCIPPCECKWKESNYREPWLLNCLLPANELADVNDGDVAIVMVETDNDDSHKVGNSFGSENNLAQCFCVLPHDCHWAASYKKLPLVLTILRLNETIIRDVDMQASCET